MEVARTTTKGDVVFVDSWTDKTNKAATISALCTIINTEDEPILVSLIAKDNSWKKATTLESIKTTTLYSVSAKTEPLTRPYERPQTGSALDTITVAYPRKRWQEVSQEELENTTRAPPSADGSVSGGRRGDTAIENGFSIVYTNEFSDKSKKKKPGFSRFSTHKSGTKPCAKSAERTRASPTSRA